jgi:hypothetical protein
MGKGVMVEDVAVLDHPLPTANVRVSVAIDKQLRTLGGN